jgi:cytochrome c oxidase subunit 3
MEIPVAVAGTNTAILLSSSITMHWTQTSIKRGNRNRLRVGDRGDVLPRA